MARLILLDNERNTYPPASAHRVSRVKWDHIAVWSVVALIGGVTVYGAIRVAIVLWHAFALMLGFGQ